MTAKLELPVILDAYRKAEKRILFLDYDGTLVPFCDQPEQSALSGEVRTLIMQLAGDPKNLVYIISGRDREFLTRQFNGMKVGLVAEHGFLVKENGGAWILTIPADNSWKEPVMGLFREYETKYPGSFIEEKEASVAYHYRSAGTGVGVIVRPEIDRKFPDVKKMFPGLELMDGDHVIEVKPGSYNKGIVAASLLRKENFDFVLAAGDDLTDERLFEDLPACTFTIKIGGQPTKARFLVPSQGQFVEFLESLLHP